MTKVIDTAETIGLLAALVEEFGPDTERECEYRQHGEPHCIAGHVVFRVGGQEALGQLKEGGTITVHETEDYENKGAANERLLDTLGFTEQAKAVLQVAQTTQDSGDNWGTALEEAQQLAAEYAVGYTE